MRKRDLKAMSLGLLLAPIFLLSAQNSPLRLVQTIPMQGVQGRLDHFGRDVKGLTRYCDAQVGFRIAGRSRILLVTEVRIELVAQTVGRHTPVEKPIIGAAMNPAKRRQRV